MGLPQRTPVLHGPNNASLPGGEATLDLQYIMGVGYGVPTTFWSLGGPGPAVGNSSYILDWAIEISNTEVPPLVTSISYGDTEDGYYNKFGDNSYVDRMNIELAKMAARGMTVLAGSGDAGATNVGEEGNDISPTDPDCSMMRPFFPSDSPYVVSVSSTFLTTNYRPVCANVSATNPAQPLTCDVVGEAAVGIHQGTPWTTGGGFSNMTKRVTWQAEAVDAYLNNAQKKGILPPTNIWNPYGRAYPDISTVGVNLLVVWGGALTPIGGTSASGPVMAGMISLLNDARLNAGKPPMGLITPWLYRMHALHPEAFNDVVVGNNFDGDIQSRDSLYPSFCPNGFTTAPGYDAVTGLGTPNFRVLRDLALSSFASM
eukprot:gnl/Hemi2/1295_TR462_c0_g6_i1.p1 gnl/Hemi2/1295_TR462_c0_g6~~gnl/Hemi2/1295_TR462_c0_g6_i1.p1  ORF type:complete len:372 (-),score=115.18 gnl/Hemi2/1295_TR462_c0_g6_i1:54-1169(-)